MDDSQKLAFISGFNTTKDQRSRQGRYKFSGDQVIFSSQRDVEAYNSYLTEINKIAQQENDWQMRAQTRSQEQLNKMQRMMNSR
jgi:hypothetical protein